MSPAPRPKIVAFDVPAPIVDLAKRRTEFLLNRIAVWDMPLPLALANAYAVGMADAIDRMNERGRLLPAVNP